MHGQKNIKFTPCVVVVVVDVVVVVVVLVFITINNIDVLSLSGQLLFNSILHGEAIGVSTLHVSAWLLHFDAVHDGNLLDPLLVNFSHVLLS